MTRPTAARRLAAALAATLAMLLTTAASAHAVGQIGVVHHTGLNADVLQYVGDAGADAISIYYDEIGGAKFTYQAGGDVQAFAGCTPTTTSTGECTAPQPYVLVFGEGGNDLITLDLCPLPAGCNTVIDGLAVGGPGNDILTGNSSTNVGTAQPAYGFAGGDGNDTLRTSNGNDELLGEGGNDSFEADDGADTVDGGDGDDTLSAESSDDAADVYRGGSGFDSIGGNVGTGLDFSEPNSDMGVSLDGVANDGEPGEGDNVMPDVERVKALGRNVTMIGSEAANELIATGNSSTIRGLGGDDRLIGSDGADTLEGGEGADYLEGGFGPDTLDGGGGVDIFVGDKTERDVIATGNDTISARDGLAEQVNCGIGSDTAVVDTLDTVDPSCESVDRGPGPKPPDDQKTVAEQLGFRMVGRTTLRTLVRRGMAFSLTCPTACRVSAELKLGSRKVGSGSKRLRAGRAGTVKVKATKAGKRRLKRLRRATLTLRVRVVDANRQTQTFTHRLRLRR